MKSIISGYIFLFPFICFSQTEKVLPIDESFKQFISCRDFTLSSNGNEAYFTIQNLNESKGAIVKAKKINNTWTNFEIVSFSGTYRDIEPFLSPDNLRLYFSSNRPHGKDNQQTDYDIWFVERTSVNSKWSQPKNIGAPINTKHNEFFPSLSTNNNLYYTSDQFTVTTKDDILYAKWNNIKYEEPLKLNENVNGKGYEFNSFISPDENFLIYTVYKAKDGVGSGDLYVSFKDKNGQFTERQNLGKTINSSRMDYSPFYDATSETLYFTSKRDNTKDIKTADFKSFQEMAESYMNGQSRIYKVKINLKLLTED
ncbi:hypothetical protein BTO06_06195 [Tenacibaculum sp. SZ-18]|uniref:PD40 domain-containing protein n=1 Tax=Tenacibaculum sp. SZ-18 TaxID=754423 RepID=UPI000C2D297B|nr:PD40 domain-containing protein [Tenacibaculum sp. SZ-18]AUC14760.1 hypothetical protein BTO06_06195 [Tenacibaculum sp. SZ-18]